MAVALGPPRAWPPIPEPAVRLKGREDPDQVEEIRVDTRLAGDRCSAIVTVLLTSHTRSVVDREADPWLLRMMRRPPRSKKYETSRAALAVPLIPPSAIVPSRVSSNPAGVLMPLTRRHMRIADTQDLRARLRPPSRYAANRVLNLSEGGVLVAGGERDIGEIVSFELSGPQEFRFAGLAEVAHSTKTATGLRFLDADASARRQIEDLIATRIRGQLLESSASGIPGLYLG